MVHQCFGASPGASFSDRQSAFFFASLSLKPPSSLPAPRRAPLNAGLRSALASSKKASGKAVGGPRAGSVSDPAGGYPAILAEECVRYVDAGHRFPRAGYDVGNKDARRRFRCVLEADLCVAHAIPTGKRTYFGTTVQCMYILLHTYKSCLHACTHA